jgi:hypothetical protein
LINGKKYINGSIPSPSKICKKIFKKLIPGIARLWAIIPTSYGKQCVNRSNGTSYQNERTHSLSALLLRFFADLRSISTLFVQTEYRYVYYVLPICADSGKNYGLIWPMLLLIAFVQTPLHKRTEPFEGKNLWLNLRDTRADQSTFGLTQDYMPVCKTPENQIVEMTDWKNNFSYFDLQAIRGGC